MSVRRFDLEGLRQSQTTQLFVTDEDPRVLQSVVIDSAADLPKFNPFSYIIFIAKYCWHVLVDLIAMGILLMKAAESRNI